MAYLSRCINHRQRERPQNVSEGGKWSIAPDSGARNLECISRIQEKSEMLHNNNMTLHHSPIDILAIPGKVKPIPFLFFNILQIVSTKDTQNPCFLKC